MVISKERLKCKKDLKVTPLSHEEKLLSSFDLELPDDWEPCGSCINSLLISFFCLSQKKKIIKNPDYIFKLTLKHKCIKHRASVLVETG